MKRAFITRNLPEDALAIARSACDIEVWAGDGPPSRDQLAARIADCEGLLCLLTDRIDADLLDQAPRLCVVSQMAVGYDNIDVPACTQRGIAVGNTPGVLTETTADLAFALLLMTARRLGESEAALRAGEWTTWRPMQFTGVDVHHAVLGIIGMGRIGFEMARRAAGFEMRILYHNRNRNVAAEQKFGAEWMPLDELLASSDFVSLHMPLNSQTRHMIGAAELAQMKPTGILINTARGAVVDQSALVDALREGKIGGAGLDVFETEPLPASDPLLTLENVVLLPHIGSASIATRTKMGVLAAQNLVAGINGLPLPHCVNPEVARPLIRL